MVPHKTTRITEVAVLDASYTSGNGLSITCWFITLYTDNVAVEQQYDNRIFSSYSN